MRKFYFRELQTLKFQFSSKMYTYCVVYWAIFSGPMKTQTARQLGLRYGSFLDTVPSYWTISTLCSALQWADRGWEEQRTNIVFGAVEAFGREVRERCLLHWERTKTEVFTWAGVLPAECKCLLLQIPIGTCRGRELSHKVHCTEKVICINLEDLISLIGTP